MRGRHMRVEFSMITYELLNYIPRHMTATDDVPHDYDEPVSAPRGVAE